MDRFENKDIKKTRSIKNTKYDCLINDIPEPIRKSVDDFKDKIVSYFETNTPKQTLYGRGKKLSKPIEKILKSLLYQKKTKTIKDRIIRGILIAVDVEEEKKERKESEKKKNIK